MNRIKKYGFLIFLFFAYVFSPTQASAGENIFAWTYTTDLLPKGEWEVEHSTTIYSGIVRMLDLALSGELHTSAGLFLVAPDSREADVRAQLQRPAFSRIADLDVRYLPYGELERHRSSIARFGSDLRALQTISHRVT